jgi:hypothetical protein
MEEKFGFAIFPRLPLRVFQPSRGGASKVPHIEQDLALTDFEAHQTRINDVHAQARYSPNDGSTASIKLQTYI